MRFPLRLNITMIVKSSATRVMGLIFGNEPLVIPLLVLHSDENEAGEEPGDEGDARDR